MQNVVFESPANVAQARNIQQQMRERLVLRDDFIALQWIAGVDVGYDPKRDLAHASIVIMDIDRLVAQETAQAYAPPGFSYVPGLLSFREIPVILRALQTLKQKPDLLMVDGQGIAHPRRMGIAAHLGVLLDMPSIGVAKSRLTGTFDMPGYEKGSRAALMDKAERIGTVLRSKERTNPLFISPGHRVSLDTAESITLRCLTRYRLPEPTRIADKQSKCRFLLP